MINILIYYYAIFVCTAVTAIPHKTMHTGCHLEFWRPFFTQNPCFQRFVICYIVIYNHAMFYTFLRTFTVSILFKFNEIRIEMWYWLPFWIFIIKFFPQRCQSGIQWILIKYTLKNTKLQKNIISTLVHGSDPFLLDY